MKQNLLIPLSLLLVIVAVLWWLYEKKKEVPLPPPTPPTPPTPTGVPFLPMYAGLSSHVQYNPADYLYGWEKYPHGPAWSFGDRVPYAEAKNALGGHFGGGLYSPRDPILESKLGGVYIGNDLYTVGGVGGDGHW
ncbi:034R [Invertebrate iridescent virus Kaz2018]|uniref:Uncharacterized protein n=1 Tax=Iridovirus Liz-CrIV TaxID=2594309 RepID=A0A5B8RLJ0_9VIRU|nr:putative protein 034R [Iridovirus Liz-CrIV]QNH08446.1 034R [Invertebrate iridescent virus Kaz2018]